MELAQKIKACHYLECSALTGEGVRELFQYATREALYSRWVPISSLLVSVLAYTSPLVQGPQEGV